MKKLISLLLTAVMILACAAAETAGSAPAQEAEPVYKTVGEALDAAGFDGMSGMMNDRYVVAGRQDGKILRSVAAVDEKYTALNNAVADADDIDAAFEALDEYARTLPILYTEEITAVPLDPAEILKVPLHEADVCAAAAQRIRQSFDIADLPDAGIAVGRVEGSIKDHYAVVAVQHDIPGLDMSHPLGCGGQGTHQVMILFVAVQFRHAQFHGQQGGKGPGGVVVL